RALEGELRRLDRVGAHARHETAVAHAAEGIAPRADVERPDRMPPVPLRHGEGLGAQGAMKLVVDTNIVLDLFVFCDPAVAALHAAIASKQASWLATQSMREELAAVLSYEPIGARMSAAGTAR